ncbi:energy transducer TonB [Roseomonas elaeocarpi]|uniref:Energy transducer TonB n=1 Tax=Roseomonas elaeocarpi TaxID=907779 RepID=A0ABV6JUW4_9PROT
MSLGKNVSRLLPVTALALASCAAIPERPECVASAEPQSWNQTVSRRLACVAEYPNPTADRPDWAVGTAILRADIDQQGNVSNATVARSSGWPQLDQAGLKALQAASPLPPPPPPAIDEKPVTGINVPFTYRVRPRPGSA